MGKNPNAAESLFFDHAWDFALSQGNWFCPFEKEFTTLIRLFNLLSSHLIQGLFTPVKMIQNALWILFSCKKKQDQNHDKNNTKKSQKIHEARINTAYFPTDLHLFKVGRCSLWQKLFPKLSGDSK